MDKIDKLEAWWTEYVDRWNERYPTTPLYDTTSAKFYVQRAVRFILTDSIDVDAPVIWPNHDQAAGETEVPELLSADDYALVADAINVARRVQEFIWEGCYPALRPYDAEGWQRLFQKRVDCIAEVDLTRHGGLASLRKRLLQQAALSIKALALVNRWVKAHPITAPNGSDGSDLRNPSPVAATVDAACGFCGKSREEVKALIRAPVGYICEECVAICAAIIDQNLPMQSSDSSIRAAAEEIAERWIVTQDLPVEAQFHSLSNLQLQVLVEHVLSKHLHPVNDLCFPKPCVHCNQIDCECSEKS